MKGKKIKVYGNVQGVFFRDNVRKFCEERGLEGYVKNLTDGGVEVVVFGFIEDLLEFIKECPGKSVVKDINISECELEEVEGFEVR